MPPIELKQLPGLPKIMRKVRSSAASDSSDAVRAELVFGQRIEQRKESGTSMEISANSHRAKAGT